MECSSWPHAVEVIAGAAFMCLLVWRLPAIIRACGQW